MPPSRKRVNRKNRPSSKLKRIFPFLLGVIGLFIIFYAIPGNFLDSFLKEVGIVEETGPPVEKMEEVDYSLNDKVKQEVKQYDEALIMATGDVMAHSPQVNQAWNPQENEYDFCPSFEYIGEYLDKADVAVANLETTLAGEERGYDGYPFFNAPDELATSLRKAGFDLICTANNHSLDHGKEGLYRTIDVLEAEGLKPFGTARSLEERNSPLIADADGIDIGFLAYTDSTNGIPVPDGKEHIVNFINLDQDPEFEETKNLFKEDIKRTKNAGADLIAVYMHWGLEYQFEPTEEQEKLAKLLAQAGADMVLGSHPHVIQPMEHIEVENKEGEKHEAFVAYSMGNFISNQHRIEGSIPTEEVKYGQVLMVNARKDLRSGEAHVEDVDYMLTWVNRNWRHRILPLHKAIEKDPEKYNIPAYQHERLEPVWEKTRERLEGYTPAFSPS